MKFFFRSRDAFQQVELVPDIALVLLFPLPDPFEKLLSPQPFARLTATLEIPPDPEWKEIRLLRTILGPHLLVRTKDGWQHLDPVSGTTRPEPPEPDRITLFEDAFRENSERYGKVDTIEGWTARTSTGIDVTLDWNRMRFHQRGSDTRRIDLLYRLHYLQWTGTKIGDRILPLISLIGLLSLAMLGLKLLRR